jgi:hypothetical protein
MTKNIEGIANKIGIYAPQGQISIENLILEQGVSQRTSVESEKTLHTAFIDQARDIHPSKGIGVSRIRKNIFLDIFDPDSRLTLGISNDLNSREHYRLLAKTLNASVFLCDDFVILPPAFLLECPLVFKLVKSASVFMEEGLIRLPIRDRSFSEFYEKKLEEYSEVVENYPTMFGKMGIKAVNWVKKYSHSRIERNAKIGQELAQIWAEGADTNPYWKKHISLIPNDILETVRQLPLNLHERGKAITWGLVAKEIPYNQTGMPVRVTQKLIQNGYIALYLNEYDLKVVSNLPFSQDSFGHGLNNLPYDYEALRAALKPLNLFDLILDLLPEELLLLRYLAGYSRFIDVFDRTAHECESVSQIRKYFAIAAASCSSKIQQSKLDLEKISKERLNPRSHVSQEIVYLIDAILLQASLALS